MSVPSAVVKPTLHVRERLYSWWLRTWFRTCGRYTTERLDLLETGCANMEHHVRCVTQKFGECAVYACSHALTVAPICAPSFQTAAPVRPLDGVGKMCCGALRW